MCAVVGWLEQRASLAHENQVAPQPEDKKPRKKTIKKPVTKKKVV